MSRYMVLLVVVCASPLFFIKEWKTKKKNRWAQEYARPFKELYPHLLAVIVVLQVVVVVVLLVVGMAVAAK